MLVSFKVSNFKSIKDPVELSFEAAAYDDLEDYYVVRPTEGVRLLKLAMIYGANASGKSNVLEALDFLRDLVLDPNEKKTDPIPYERFAFDRQTQSGNSKFEIVFYQEAVKYHYSVTLNPEAIIAEELYYYSPNKAKVFSRTTDVEKQLSSLVFGSKIRLPSEDRQALENSTLWNNTTFGGFLKTNIDFTELLNALSWFKHASHDLITPSSSLLGWIAEKLENRTLNKEQVIAILRQADFNITDIKFEERKLDEPERFKRAIQAFSNRSMLNEGLISYDRVNLKDIRFEHTINDNSGNRKFYLTFNSESLGTQRFYQLAAVVAIMVNNRTIFSIDELESSLHPELVKHFIKTILINVKNSQLLFTTHLRELLSQRDILRNDVVYFVEKRPDGSSDLFSADDFDSGILRRKEGSLYNAYRYGKLGAIPELNDAYIDG